MTTRRRWAIGAAALLVAAAAPVVGAPRPADAAGAGERPYRVLDTRRGTRPGSGTVLTVNTGRAGAAAVGVNITVTENTGAGYVTAWSGAGPMPTASILNTDAPRQTRANYALVPVQADGTFRLYTQQPAHLVVDVMNGFDGACTNAPASPQRVLDTRTGARPGAASDVTVSTGRPGVAAVGVNITVAENGGPGFVTAWSGDGAMPTASVVNTDAVNQIRANYAVVPVRADGTFRLHTQASAHLVVDVMGTFDAGCSVPAPSPVRVLDTRAGARPGVGAVLAVPTAHAGADAVGVNITVTDSAGPGYATAWSGDGAPPTASVVNTDAAGQTLANFVVVPLQADGSFRLYTQNPAHLVVDVMGTLTPTPAPAVSVIHVVDGDTVDVSTGQRIRLIGIDAPEVGVCGSAQATARLAALVLGRGVQLVPGARDDVDSYGRLLRYVDVDGVDAGEVLLREGLAVPRYDSTDGYGAHTREARYAAAAASPVCPAPTAPPATAPPATTPPGTVPPAGNCSPAYPTVCIPPPLPDLDCGDIPFRRFTVLAPDPHGFDGNPKDGIGCETG